MYLRERSHANFSKTGPNAHHHPYPRRGEGGWVGMGGPLWSPGGGDVDSSVAMPWPRATYGRAWQDASWHSRGDGLSSPWGGVVALLGSLLPAVPIMDGEWYICASRMKSRFCGLPAVPIMDGECYPGMATHSSTVKRLPCPSVLSTAIEPPMAVTRSWTIASPSPKPPVVRVREASER